MQNPWLGLSPNPPFVLECDKHQVKRFNDKAPDHFKLQLNAFPGPFMGNPNAPVVLLNLNPGFAESDNAQQSHLSEGQTEIVKGSDDLAELPWRNLHHQELEYPFYLLDPRVAEAAGQGWWMKKLKSLITPFGIKHVANNLLCVEYFPYPSVKAAGFHKRLSVESQKYGFYLVEEAMRREAVIIIMRSGRPWLDSVSGLDSYDFKYTLNSPWNVTVSPRNCPDGFPKIIEKLNENYHENHDKSS